MVVAYLFALVASVALAAVVIAFGAGDQSITAVVAGLIGEWSGFVGVPLVISSRRGTRSVARDFGFRLAGWRDAVLGAAAGGVTYVVLLIVVYPPVLRLLGHFVHHRVEIGQSAQNLSRAGRGPGFVVFALAVGLGAPLAEELFFRGLVLGAVRFRWGPAWAVVVSGVVFGLAHAGSTETAALPALVGFGLVLGVLAVRTGRLGAGVVAHMVFNGLTVAQLALAR